MTPTFDFSAFLNSPAACSDPTLAFSAMGPAGMSTSTSNDAINTLDNTQASFGDNISYDEGSILPDWASTLNSDDKLPATAQSLADSIPMAASVSQPEHPSNSTGAFTTQYRAGIAAHHMTQLSHWLPKSSGAAGNSSAGLGGAGQRSQGGSRSAPTVPLSQASRLPVAKRASELTIQERRRLSRRGQAVDHGVSQPTPPSPVQSNMDIMPPCASVPNFPEVVSPSKSTVLPSPQLANIHSDFAKRAYSATGFDLIGALIKVATRPNPKIEIGPVDLSCSFTVSDAKHPDQPIVHCSDTFCQLTGYDRSEIIGRNCRFLQSPDGHVEAGSERTHTDNGAVRHVKKHVMRMQECQTSLINYRRDGSPFINLITIVPITWGDSTDAVFLVGFQVDLVEQPGAVMERKPNGLYVVNYSSPSAIPSNHMVNNNGSNGANVIKDAAEAEASKKAMLAEELAEIIGSGSEDTSKWARILLENSHDIVHVLSLKGTFLYVSPSVENLLGYKPEELVGKSISEFCHPSDVVPVFRELKDSTSNASIAAAARHWARRDGTVNPPTKGGAGQTGPQVNLIMRMKHKQHGHEWVENVGKLHLEQGKGRKVVISTGRARPIYNLPWEQARRSLNSRSEGFWFKASNDGLILSTSGNVTDVVEGGSPTTEHSVQLAGKHLKSIVNADALGALLGALKSLQVSAIPHLMTNGLGGPAQMVISTVVPSSAGGIGLPSVLVYTQRASPTDYAKLQQNSIYPQDASLATSEASQAATLKAGEPSAGSVFGELSTSRSSSWVFELHQLKNANKRLREEVRAHQRRIYSGGRLTMAMPPQSPSKTKTALPKIPVTNRFLNTQSIQTNSSGSEISLSPTPFSVSTSASGTDATTTISSGSEYSVAGTKRSRS